MALQSFTITVGAQVDANGKNYVAGQAVYIKKLNGTLASIYSDLGGLSPIPQDGFSNVTNVDGQFTFYVETGEYNAESGGKVTPITVVGSDYFNSKINEVVLELSKSRGFRVVGDFASGFTYELPNDVGVDAGGNHWVHTDINALPVIVSAGTAPSAPTYTQVTFSDHSALVNRDTFGAHKSDAIDFTDYTNQRAKLNSYTAGSDAISGATLRDTFVTSRTLNGLTDCHAFADRTVIENATDSGTYGTFDSTTVISGTHNQSHQYSYQDRAIFSGTGTIGSWGGAIFEPKLIGSGYVTERFAIEIRNIDTLGRFDAIGNLYGVKIDNQTKGQTNNFAFWTDQNVGYSIWSSGNGEMYHKGNAAFGGELTALGPVAFGASVPVSGVAVTISGGTGKQKSFASTSSISAQWGVVGDFIHQFVSNGAERILIGNSTDNYALHPASGTQNLGTNTKRWNIAKLKEVNFDPISASSASNLSLFVDSSDGALKFKDGTGTVNILY